METGPSPIAERIVGVLLPLSRRDEVMGDLQERFTSTKDYLIDASQTVPLVVWSQIRRTTTLARLGAQATGMLAALALVSTLYGPTALPPHSWWCALLPVALALLTIVFRDAYADAERSASEQLADDSVGPMNALLVEYVLFLVGSPVALALGVVIPWTASSFLVLAVVRALAPSRPRHRGSRAGGAASLSHEGALDEAASLRGRMLWSALALMLGIWIHAFIAMDGTVYRLLQIFVALPAMLGVTLYKWYMDTRPTRGPTANPAEFRQELEVARDTMRHWSAWHRIATVTMIAVPVLIWMLASSAGRGDLSKAVIWVGVLALWTRAFFVGHGLSKRTQRAFQRALDDFGRQRQ